MMKALLLTRPGEFSVQSVEVPTPGPKDVLCRIKAVAICGSDPKIMEGKAAGKWPPSFPFIPGHEWAGEVVATGKEVLDFKPGDRVAGEAHSGCGFCSRCKQGQYNLCENYGNVESGHRHYGHLSSGAYAQYNLFRPRSITKMPDGVSYAQGALVDTAGTGLYCLELCGVPAGSTVVIIGPGPIGLLTVRLSRLLGAAKVIVVGRGHRLEAAGNLGADLLVNFEQTNPVQAVMEFTENIGADRVFECSAAADTLSQAIAMAKRGGKIGMVGIPAADYKESIPLAKIVLDQISIVGSRANPNVSRKVLDFIAAKQLDVETIITHRFPLTDFDQAYTTFIERREGAIKVIVEPN